MLSSLMSPTTALLGLASHGGSAAIRENTSFAFHLTTHPAHSQNILWTTNQKINLGVIYSLGLLGGFFLIFVSCFYNIFFHPLSQYPGPWLAKITCAYGAYYNWRGDPHLQIYRLHQIYGDHVRWGPNMILINTPGALQDIYRAGDNVKKHHRYSLLASIPNTISSHEEPVHKLKKKLISSSLSQMAIREHETTIVEVITRLTCCITNAVRAQKSQNSQSNTWSAPFNMAHWLDYVMLDIMGKVAFDVDWNTVGNPESQLVIDSLIQDIKTTQKRSIVLSYLPQLLNWNLDRLIFTKECLAGLRFVRFVSKIVKDRLATASDPTKRDILSNLINSEDPMTGKSPTRGSLISESAMLIIAGADTSATTLSALLFYLVRNPLAYARLATELRTTFNNSHLISLGPKLSSCTYLRACVNETLRMTPPVGSLLPREVLPGGAIIGGHVLPAGTGVGTGIYSIHHHSALGDPHVWRPERWLQQDTTMLKSCFNAWSGGSTVCAGQQLAQAEMMLTMAFLFVNFDFRKSEEGSVEERILGEGGWKGCGNGRERKGEYQLWDRITSAKNGPMIQFTERNQ